MIVAPPNLTRQMELKYSHPAVILDEFIYVEAKFTRHAGRKLYFTANARNPGGKLLARARAMHWIVDD